MADDNPRLKKPLAGLTLAALGVVYGDIGTSPLYAAKERLFAAMARHARTAGDYFNIPAARVIELGTKIEI